MHPKVTQQGGDAVPTTGGTEDVRALLSRNALQARVWEGREGEREELRMRLHPKATQQGGDAVPTTGGAEPVRASLSGNAAQAREWEGRERKGERQT